MVSIIVPVYNVEDYLERCLNSLLIQDCKNIEILLIDDGSTDGSSALCDTYASLYSQITVYHKENGGVSSARNYGMEKMSAEGYAMFVDADDYVEPDFVSSMLSLAEKYVNSLIACQYIRENADGSFGQTHQSEEKTELFSGEDRFIAILKENIVSGYVWNKIYDKTILREHNIEFDSTIQVCEDLLFNMKYINNVENVVFFHGEMYRYMYNSNSATCLSRFIKEKWISELTARKMIIKCIPREYVFAKQVAYNDLFNETIYYWIRMYKTGEFKHPDKSTKEELKQMRTQASFTRFKSRIYYCGIIYFPYLLYNVIYNGVRFRNLKVRINCKKECKRFLISKE